jgi:hypothetical protein
MFNKFILILLLHTNIANAGCFDGLQTFFNINPYQIKFTSEALEKISLNDEILFPILKLKNIPEEHFFYLLSLYPAEFKEKLLKFPAQERASLFYKTRLQEASDIPDYSSTSTIQSLIDYFHGVRLARDEVHNWLEQGLKKIETMPKSEYQKLQSTTALYMRESQASFEFKTRYYISLAMQVKDNEKNLIIGNTSYKVMNDDPKNFIILVPKNKIRSPIWNPLERAKRESIIKNPELNAPPAAYLTGIGLDGHFYLEDGNHRFHMMEKREMIPIKILFPTRTLTLSQFIYYVSNFSPTMNDMLKIHSHEIDPLSILPKGIRDSLIFKSNQLQKK